MVPMGGATWRRLRTGCLVFLVMLAVPAVGRAETYRFEDGAYLGAASMMIGWAQTLARQEAETQEFDACLASADACPPQYRGVRVVMNKARDLATEKQIRLINRFVNDRRYRRDKSVRRVTALDEKPVRFRSRWSTVGEFFTRGGDCEDYATTKYFLLRALGLPAADLRVVVSWDRQARGYHAILAIRLGADSVWLLDSNNRIYKHRHTGYRYIYAVNENAVWDHEQDVTGSLSHAVEPTVPPTKEASS